MDGAGPAGWPSFLAMVPKARHMSSLEHVPSTLLTAFRDLALTLERMVSKYSVLHGDVTPGNVLLAQPALGDSPRLLLTDFHGAQRMGMGLPPTTPRYSALGLSYGESPSLMTDLESVLYTLLYIASGERLSWKHEWARRHTDAVKAHTMVTPQLYEQQLQHCPEELRQVLRDLRLIFWPGGAYRSAPTQADSVAAAKQFASVCDSALGVLGRRKRGRPKGSKMTRCVVMTSIETMANSKPSSEFKLQVPRNAVVTKRRQALMPFRRISPPHAVTARTLVRLGCS